MAESRRRLLITLLGAAGVLTVKPFLHGLQARSSPQARPYPNGRDPNKVPMEDHHNAGPEGYRDRKPKSDSIRCRRNSMK